MVRSMNEGSNARPAGLRLLITVWGVASVVAVLIRAVFDLTPIAMEALDGSELTWWQWSITAVWVGFMAYSEGYQGFHRSFSPRVVARAFHLAEEPRAHRVLLAPAYCMGLFHARRRTLVVAWIVTLGVVVLVLIVREIPQPWRGLIDLGVVIGLALGSASILMLFVRGLIRPEGRLEDASLPES
jgi:hypothetical protein